MKKKKKNDEKRERNGEKSKKKTSKNETITTKKNEEKRKLPRIYAADDSVTLGVWQNEHYACISGARMMRAANIICRFTCLHCCVLRHYLHAKWLQLLCKFIACRLHRRHSLFDCNFVWLYPTIYSNSRQRFVHTVFEHLSYFRVLPLLRNIFTASSFMCALCFYFVFAFFFSNIELAKSSSNFL